MFKHGCLPNFFTYQSGRDSFQCMSHFKDCSMLRYALILKNFDFYLASFFGASSFGASSFGASSFGASSVFNSPSNLQLT